MNRTSKRTGLSKRGFTLVEIMVTVAILAFGIVSIYEAFFISIDTYGYYRHYLSTQDWISEKIWEVQKDLIDNQEIISNETYGQIVRDHKKFDWVMTVTLLDETEGLYRVKVKLSWHEGDKLVSTAREAYLLSTELRIYNEKGSV